MKPKAKMKKVLVEMDRAGARGYTSTQLSVVLSEHRIEWELPTTYTIEDFIDDLQREGNLRSVTLSSTDYKSLTRFVWGAVSPYQLALTVRKGAFISHGSAAFLHDITDQLTHTIYVNAEQSPKPPSKSSLTQESITRAFRVPQRTSNLVYQYGDWRIAVLAGKNTGRMEVGAIPGPDNELLEATKLERTLIDLTVRPAYAGGPRIVLEAFKRARARVSTNVLVATLKKFAYVYPYHQAIGFYMERAGYPTEKLKRLSNLKMAFDFYLMHAIKNPEFVPKWRLFVPRQL